MKLSQESSAVPLVVALALLLLPELCAGQEGPPSDIPVGQATEATLLLETEAPRRKRRVKLRGSVGLRGWVTTNLYHVSERNPIDEDKFDNADGPGERFEGMRGPWDVIGRVDLDLALRIKTGKKRYLSLGVGVEHTAHGRNPIADYDAFQAAISYDVTRKLKVKATAGYEPEHFRKNYPYPFVLDVRDPVTGEFPAYDRADMEQRGGEAEVKLDLGKWLKVGAFFGRRERIYNDLFNNRNQERTRYGGLVKIELGKRIDLDVRAGVGRIETPDRVEFGVRTDRSADEALIEVVLRINPKGPRDFELQGKHRVREYTTTEPLDFRYFDQNNTYQTISVTFIHNHGKHMRSFTELIWSLKATGISDPGAAPDSVDYDEFIVLYRMKLAF